MAQPWNRMSVHFKDSDGHRKERCAWGIMIRKLLPFEISEYRMCFDNKEEERLQSRYRVSHFTGKVGHVSTLFLFRNK